MKKITPLICALLLLAMAGLAANRAHAQQSAPPTPEEINATIQVLQAQRNAAQDQVAQLAARMATVQAELEKAKTAAAACHPKDVKPVK